MKLPLDLNQLPDPHDLDYLDRDLYTLVALANRGDMGAARDLHATLALMLSDSGKRELTEFARIVLTWMHFSLVKGTDPAEAMLMKKGPGNVRQIPDIRRDLMITFAVMDEMSKHQIKAPQAARNVQKCGDFTVTREHEGGAKPLSYRSILNIYRKHLLPK